MIRSAFRISFHKITAYFGGRTALILVAVLLLCCLTITALIANVSAPDTIETVIVDLCDGPYSRDFCDAFCKSEGIRAEVFHTVSEGEDRLLFDDTEVMLILSQDYDFRISELDSENESSDSNTPMIAFKTAPGAESAELLRETAAGLLLSQRSKVRIRNALEAEGYDVSNFEKYISEAPLAKLYSVSFSEGSSNSYQSRINLVRSGFNGVAALALLLILLTLTRRMADPSSELVSERIETVHKGKQLAFISDCFALWFVAMSIAVVSYALSPSKGWLALFGWICYSLCITGICILISGFGSFGRIDILAPFLAIATSVVGGCFTDLSLLSNSFTAIARCTPQGQLFAAINGNGQYCFALLGEGAFALMFAYLIRRKHSIQ